MVTQVKQPAIKSFKVEFCDEPVTAWGGMAVIECLAARLGLWKWAAAELPARRGCTHDWLSTIKAAVSGLLTGAQGTYAAEPVRSDPALMKLLGLGRVTEEANLWRMLQGLGQQRLSDVMRKMQLIWTRRLLAGAPRRELLHGGWLPVFVDGTLLEGSARREGTKWMGDKGRGLLWATVFAGPLLAAGRLCRPGEGETAALMEMLPGVLEHVLAPLKLQTKALALLDSLHGDEPALEKIESLGLHYIAGANKLREVDHALADQPGHVWRECGARPELGWSESAVCVCWIQCREWKTKRLLVGRRFRREGEFLHEYRGVMTSLRENDLRPMMRKDVNFAQALWRLYDHKGAMETQYKELLDDLGLHHPPCQSLVRNQGFYQLAALAALLGRGLDLIGGHHPGRGAAVRRDGRPRKRPTPRSMRLWRMRRTLLALPARVRVHARQAKVQILGATAPVRAMFNRYWLAVCRC